MVRESRETINKIYFNVKCTVIGQSMVICTCKEMSHQSPQRFYIITTDEDEFDSRFSILILV